MNSSNQVDDRDCSLRPGTAEFFGSGLPEQAVPERNTSFCCCRIVGLASSPGVRRIDREPKMRYRHCLTKSEDRPAVGGLFTAQQGPARAQVNLCAWTLFGCGCWPGTGPVPDKACLPKYRSNGGEATGPMQSRHQAKSDGLGPCTLEIHFDKFVLYSC